ncbi:MAG: DHH family phosphoesterase [Clostridiales bacterium]|nr:DHH family phosphoesterase [Clostridiales bacterium]
MKGNRIQGTLRSYLRWPLLLTPLLFVMNIHIYFVDVKAGAIMTLYVSLYTIIAFLLLYYKRGQLLKDIVTYAIRFNHTTKRLANDLDIPILIADWSGNCLWHNNKFKENFCPEGIKNKFAVDSVIPNLTVETYPKTYEKNSEIHFHCEDVFYKAVIQKVNVDKMPEKEGESADTMGLGDNFYVFFIYDETEIVHYIKENNEQRLDVGLLYIDNYDESLEPVDEVRRALLSAMLDRKINKYMSKIDAITKKLEKDKYIFLFKHKYLSYLQNDKFSLLDDIRNINVREEGTITISMGIGTQGETYKKRQEYSRTAIDLALARGGDQVVVKTKDNLLYYGGKSRQQEKNTRVKARVKAHALRESIEAAEQVIIMAHRMPDEDALGSAVGIYRIADSLGKPAHIVINKVSSSLRPVVNMLLENGNYPEDFIISGETAKEIFTEGTLLVIVDVNHVSYTDEPALVEKASSLVVLDHHRQSGESFANPTLSYIESYASSACEMVAEFLQYVGDEVKLKPYEADVMYSGIMIDTNNFLNKPGVRTFEAVAFLRRSGADISKIRKLFRCDIHEYKIRAQAVQNTEIYMDYYAISQCDANECESPTIIGAKIANELLDIDKVKATFVLTEYEGKIYISARSIDELNVQIVMERLGGGGHINSAGAQLENCTLAEGVEILHQTLQQMKQDGDLI